MKKFFKERLTLLIAVLFPTYMFFLHAPLEMFLTNRGDFWFGLADMWWLTAAVFAIIFAVLFLIGAFLPKTLRNVYAVLGIAGGLCVYVQGNFLNLDLGALNGSEIVWSDYKSQFLTNAAIWLSVIAIAIVLFAIFKQKALKVLSTAAGLVMLMQMVTLGTLLVSGIPAEANYSTVSGYSVTDKNLYTVSDDENVIVMILDMFDNEYMRTILQENPETKETFKDFTFFDNAVGSHSTTAYSVGTILTGGVIGNEEAGLKENVDKAFESTKLFDDLAAQGYVFDMYTNDGMTPQKLLEASTNYQAVQAKVSSNTGLMKNLYRLVICRFAPDVLKQRFWLYGTEFAGLKTLDSDHNKAFTDDNYTFYQGLQNTELTLSDEKRFKVIHLNGVHFPYTIDAEVNPIPSTSAPEQAMDTAKGTLKIAETYINAIKAAGAYENSTIILLADHGYYDPGVLTNPLIMVKQAGVTNDFTISNAPVSHYDLHATIMSSLRLNEDGRYGKSMFDIQEGEQRNRVFYQHNLNESHVAFKFTLLEWAVDDAGNARKYFTLTGKEIDKDGNVLDHTQHCKYCQQHGTDPVDAPNAEKIVHDLNGN